MNTAGLFSSYLRRLRSGVAGDPVRDWLILLTLWVIALVIIIVWNVWAFDTIARGGAVGTAVKSVPALSSQSAVDSISAVFEQRAVEESKYVNGIYRFADPSQ